MKKLLSLIIAAAMLLTLTACNDDKDTKIEIPEQFADYKPLPVPESGWNSETAASVFFLNGKPLPFPFTVDSLGEGYYLNEEEISAGMRGTSCVLYYGDTPLLNVSYYLPLFFEELSSHPVDSFSTYNDTSSKVNKKIASSIFFNGITIGATKDEIRECFGDPDREAGKFWWIYNYNRAEGFTCIHFSFNDKGEMYKITFYYYTDEEVQQALEEYEKWLEEYEEPEEPETPPEPENPTPPRG